MPQLIFNSLNKDKFKTFIIDFEKKEIPLMSWIDIFNMLEKKTKYSKKIFYIVDINGKTKPYKYIKKHKLKLDLWDYAMYNSVTNERNNDFYISFGVHISSIKN